MPDEDLDHLVCKEEDEITGAKCTLPTPHDLPHRDESDLGLIFHFREGQLPKLLLPGETVGMDIAVPNPGTNI